MGAISLGIGLTNDCNLSCAHCYRPKDGIAYLGLEDVRRCLDSFDVGSVNLGTGENILNPALPAVLDELARRDIRTSLTSNGLSLLRLDEAALSRLHDVEVSFDFAIREEMDGFRGPGAFDTAVRAVERCVRLGLKVTILAVMMRTNYDRLGAIARLAAGLGATFRVNVYQPVYGRELMPSHEQFWEGFRRLFSEASLITCTEPVVVAALELGGVRAKSAGCGSTSVRLTPTGRILPCVYWPSTAPKPELTGKEAGLRLLESPEFVRCRSVPAACGGCRLEPACGGGCASRLAILGEEKDPYCPLRGPEPVKLTARLGEKVELLHAANVCTTIVRAD